jgi:beta-phosphoglucomutase-like phosphatase (HAD superfamily)
MTDSANAGDRRLVLPGRFRAAVFDMDGVLLDSEPLWITVYADVAARHGGSYGAADRPGTLGQPLSGTVRYLAGKLGADPEVIAVEVGDAIGRHYLDGPPLVAGAGELVAALAGRLPMAVATNTTGDVATRALAASGLEGFGAVVSGADLGSPKPHPAVYLEACRRLGVDPAEAVAFEDSAVGIRSALDAGLTVVAVPQEGVDLSGAGAHIVLASLGDVTLEP